MSSLAGLQAAIMHGAVRRIRPKVMTVACMFLGLVPIMWSTGAGADVMKRIAAPMIGGIFTSFILELAVYPAIYEVWKWNFEVKRIHQAQDARLNSFSDVSTSVHERSVHRNYGLGSIGVLRYTKRGRQHS
jgi:Cu(I)/Ag(I) efflux system membrane protein CusA/SilA